MSTRGPWKVVGYRAHSSVKEPAWLVWHCGNEQQTATCLDRDDAERIAALLNGAEQ